MCHPANRLAGGFPPVAGFHGAASALLRPGALSDGLPPFGVSSTDIGV